MSHFRLLPVIVLSFAALHARAQEPKPRVLLQKDRMAAQFDTVNVVKNALKLNPLQLFRGEIPLFYERALTYRLSVEVGLGVTLRDYLGLTLRGDDVDDFGRGIDIVPRPSYHIAARFYLGHDLEPQGWYLQPGFTHLEYIKDIRTQSSDGTFTDEILRDQRVFNDLRLLLGYQMLAASSNWLFDLYGGFAYRDRDMSVVRETINLQTLTFEYDVERRTDRVPAFFIGVKVGLGF